MSESLGKAVLELDANLGPLERNLKLANRAADDSQKHLDALAAVADLAKHALQEIKMKSGQAAETKVSAVEIIRGVKGISDEAHDAARTLRDVKLGEEQAAETEAVGAEIDHVLERIQDKAHRTREALARVKLFGGAGGGNRPGYGLGPFGAGYGRLGVVGTLVGLGAVAGPALGPGALGLLAGLPTLAAGGAGALGTLALAFSGVGKAIGGDLKAFKALEPAQQAFVLRVRSLDGFLDKLKQTAGSSLFPGLTKGLTAALSPGTLGVITKAVREFGAAIGQAGAEWGRYFGSTSFQQILGPLLQAGARGFAVMSQAALSLFDAFGVLGRAAIPLVNWLEDSALKGARWVDTFLRAKDASGALARGMVEAQSSLRLAGKLIEALVRLVVSLGKVLYPISKVALKDLTDGINALSKVIDHNRGAIQALIRSALDGLVLAIKTAAKVIGFLSDKFQGLPKTAQVALAAVALALTIALGPTSAAIVGVITAIGLIRDHWTEFKTFFGGLMTALQGIATAGIGYMLVPFAELTSALAHLLGWIPGIGGKIGRALSGASSFIHDLVTQGVAEIKQGGGQMASAFNGNGPQAGSVPGLDDALHAAAQAGTPANPVTPVAASPFGAEPPFTTNVPKAKKPKKTPREKALEAILAAVGLTGGSQMPSGVNLLSDAARLAIDRAKMTPGKLDDIKAYDAAIAELKKFAKTMRDSNKIPIADELAALSQAVNTLKGNMDGFNLTLAEQRRHFLDARYADKYHTRAKENMTGTPGPAPITYAPTFVSPDEKASKREAKRDWFRFRQTVMAG